MTSSFAYSFSLFLFSIKFDALVKDAAKPNHTPKKCYIKDENGGTMYKDFGWKPVKLNLHTGLVDIKERWTKEVCLESFPLDYSTDLERILLEQGDKKVTSTLRKSKLAGHPLALEMMKASSEILTEFKGLDSVAFVLGNKEPSETDDLTGDEIWKDVKSLRALLHGAELPKKSGAGVTREAKVLANESFLKVRIYYRAFFSNDVVTDHHEKFDGKQYWNFPIKYLFQYNDIPNAAVVYEDVELRFFTDVRVSMDNKDWEWVKGGNGRWEKQFGGISTTVSRRKSLGTVSTTKPETIELPSNDEATPERNEEKDSPSNVAKATTDSKVASLETTTGNEVQTRTEAARAMVVEYEIADKIQNQKENENNKGEKLETEEDSDHMSTTKGDEVKDRRMDASIDEVKNTTGHDDEIDFVNKESMLSAKNGMDGSVRYVDAKSVKPIDGEANVLQLIDGHEDEDTTPSKESGSLEVETAVETRSELSDNMASRPRQSRPDPDGVHLNETGPNQAALLEQASQFVEVL